MKKYLKLTPEGTKDFLFAECSAMDDICGKIERVFVSRGFKKVITPGIEFYDVFSVPCSGIAQEEMFKLTDNKGRLLVARPDSTLPIARVMATRLKNSLLPIRLYYKQAVYRNQPTLRRSLPPRSTRYPLLRRISASSSDTQRFSTRCRTNWISTEITRRRSAFQ